MSNCPIPMPDGSDCWRPAEPDGFAGICRQHMYTIAQKWLGDERIQRVRCQECLQLALIPDRLQRAVICANCKNVTILEYPNLDRRLGTHEPRRHVELIEPPRTDVVYYLRFGDRIKIGTTSNLPRRITVIPHDELLAIEPGAFDKERSRHAEFRAYRIAGQKEWFAAAPQIMEFTHTLQEKYGPPMGAWKRWTARAA